MSREHEGARSVAGPQQDAAHALQGLHMDPALTGPTGLSARLQAADIRANGGLASPAPAVQRQAAGASSADGPMCAPEQAAPPEPGINKAGFIDHSDGSNIRTGPAESGGQALTSTPLPPATRVFVTGTHPDAGDWWYVSAHAPEGIVLGYVQHFRVNTDLPEPGAKLYAIQSGDTAEKIAAGEFSDAIRPGHDLRFYENVLLSVNQQAGRDGIHGTHQDPGILGGGSNNIQLTAGKRIWLVSPGYARTLEGIVPDGSLTNGAYGQAKEALAHVQDILASVTMAPDVAAEVAGQYLEVIQAHLTEIIAVVSLFIAAEAAASLLAASPTGVGQIAAAAIQLILAAVAGYSAVQAAGQALTEGSQWLTLAWGAKGDPAQIAEASKAFVRMLVQIALAALAALGAQASVGKAGQITGKLDIQLPRIAMAMTPEGVMLPQYIPGQVGTSGATAIEAGVGAGPQVGMSMAMSSVRPSQPASGLKWGNPKSRPAYGHTFLEHGQKLKPQQLIDRARSKGHQVGQWTDDASAAEFIAKVAKEKGPGTHDVPLAGSNGRGFLGSGAEVTPDMARIVVKPDGSVRTAFPYSSAHPN